MFRLAHISDIHLAPLPQPSVQQLASKRITGYLNWKLNRKGALHGEVLGMLLQHMKTASPDHIAVTGDLVNLALPEEITNARKWLDKLGAAKNVSVIPGNHDTYVPGALTAIMKSWHLYVRGDGTTTEPYFPYLRIRNEVALIGVNSGCATLPFMATGTFGQKQAESCGKLLEEAKKLGKFRVVMIHHPPFKNATSWSKRLIGDHRFRAMAQQHGAELVLHGHTHIDSFEWINGLEKKVPVVGVPSASQSPTITLQDKYSRPGARYNLFQISGGPGGWFCEMNEYGFANGANSVTHINKRTIYDGVTSAS